MADDLPNWNLNIFDPMDDDFKFKFIDVSSVDELFAQQENENMKKKTTYDLNIVLKFLREYGKKGENKRKSHRRELNLYLSEFIIAGKTKKGEQYEPSSLKRILPSIDRVISQHANMGKNSLLPNLRDWEMH